MNDERVHTSDAAALRLIEAVRTFVPLLMAKHQTPGLNLAIADKGKLIWEAGFGLADIAANRPMLADTVYHSGSLGKTYTATAIMILVDRGTISLDDPINKHLPFRVENPLGEREITVHDLLVHKSGLGADAAASHWTGGASLADDLAVEYARPQSPIYAGAGTPRWIAKVGAQWMYSNLGIATLGLIVEQANPEKLGFSAFVQRHIMDPLGMTLSCYPVAQHPDHVDPRIWAMTSTGYARMGTADIPTAPVYFREYPAGGALQRPADHIRLMLAMMNDGELDGYRLFAPEIAKAMLSPATTLARSDAERATLRDFDGEQGLVWRLNDVGTPRESFDHGGGHMFGWRTQGRAWPAHKAAVMVASNQWALPNDPGEVQELADFVGSWLRYRPLVDSAEPVLLEARTMSFVRGVLLAGAYRAATCIEGNLPEGALDAIIARTRSRGNDWDADALRRGFDAGSAIEPTIQAFAAFWQSPASEVDPETARKAYAALSGTVPGFLSPLLPE